MKIKTNIKAGRGTTEDNKRSALRGATADRLKQMTVEVL